MQHKRERGQALILIVLGVVVLLGFTALAVDGGMVYSDRRQSQNGSDSASLAGGGAAGMEMENQHIFYSNFNCNNSKMGIAKSAAISAAINQAGNNDYVIDNDMSDYNGVTTDCGIDNTNPAFPDKYLDVIVHITRDTPTSFAHFVFGDALTNKVEAITRIRPRQPLAFGYAIVALNPASCSGQSNGAGFHGTSDVNVVGGGIFSNGCMRGDGNTYVNVTNGSIAYFYRRPNDNPADWADADGGIHQLVGDEMHMPPEAWQIPQPDCAAAGAHNVSASYLLDPDNHPLSGLYCVTGDLRINANDTIVGQGVTLYMINGLVKINGSATVKVTAPLRAPDPAPAIAGVVLTMAPGNNSDVQINGNAESFWTGTILAPESDVDMLGNGVTDAFKSQIIGWNVEVGGTANTNVVFDDNIVFSRPTRLELSK